MNIPPWLKDKRVQLGMAAAAAVGVGVLAKNRSSAKTDQGDGSTSQSGNYVTPAQYDSSGYDVGAQINDAFNGISDDLRGFTDTLTDIQTQLGQVNGPTATTPTTPTKVGTATGSGSSRTTPATRANPKASYVKVTRYTTASAARGSNWTSTLSTIASHYHTSVSSLLKLNPTIKNPNKIYANQQIRVK